MASKVEFLQVGREGDDTLIDGASPWANKWESASSSAFIAKHPSHPSPGYVVHLFRALTVGVSTPVS
jgi:hypothetical protein